MLTRPPVIHSFHPLQPLLSQGRLTRSSFPSSPTPCSIHPSLLSTLPCSLLRMPREIVSVHVGQCGLQMGMTFWEAALQEHQQHSALATSTSHSTAGKRALAPSSSSSSSSSSSWSRSSAADDAMSTFFATSPSPSSSSSSPPYRARAVLVDMESGVLNAISRSSLSWLFDADDQTGGGQWCSVRDVSGAGNNW